MKNRDKYITQRNEYDLMMSIHENTGDECSIPLLTGQPVSSLPCLRSDWVPMPCRECIQKWLNEEA